MTGRSAQGPRLLLCLLLVAGVLPSNGQEKREPPRREVTAGRDTSARTPAGLPNIDLPEYDITGDEVIDLPGFAKPSAEGGTVIDPLAGRGTGSRESVADAGIGKMRNQPGTDDGMRGRAAASYGSFVTPSLQASFGTRFDGFDALLKGAYRSSEGYEPNRDFREASASLSVGTESSAGEFPAGVDRFRATLAMEGDGYRLFGSRVPDRTRTVERMHGELTFTGATELFSSFEGGLRLGGTTVEDSLESRETELGLSAGAKADLGSLSVEGDAGFWVDFYRPPSGGSNPLLLTLHPTVRKMLSDGLELSAGLRFHLVRGSDTPALGRLWPEVGLSWYATDRLRLFAAFDPTVERMNLGTLVRSNPYLRNDEVIRHTEYPVAVRAGVEYTPSRSWTMSAAAVYREARNLPVPLDPGSEGMWSFAYEGTTRITGFEGEIFAQITADDQLAATVELRSLEHSSTGKAPPYYPAVTAGLSYSKRFAFGLSAGTRLQAVGTQYIDAANTATLPSYLLWSLEAEYRILPPLGVTFGLTNILNARAERFKGYETRPRAVALGLTCSW
jgi:hypothetical protein